MNKQNNAWIVGIGGPEREYVVNGVRYFVSSRFVNSKENMRTAETMKERIEKYVKSDFADLTVDASSDIITDEYVCSSASQRKEETSADEN